MTGFLSIGARLYGLMNVHWKKCQENNGPGCLDILRKSGKKR